MTQFKATATRRINLTHGTPGAQVWQRNYHDRIIRNEHELMTTRVYIEHNQMNWALDADNPHHQR